MRGLFNIAHAFLPTRNPGSVFIGINAASWQVPQMGANWTGYNASKVAACKLVEDLGTEYPDLHVVSLHPGIGEFAL